nr:MAG TPA: hypothetical protein [Caudoviricetes sp.]
MIKTKGEYENFVVKLLELVISGHIPCSEDFPGFSEKDFYEVLSQCVEDQLLLGYNFVRNVNGDPCGQRVGDPFVTIKGLSYMDSVKQAQALQIAKEAEKNSIVAKLKANRAFILSLFSILLTIVINLDKIVTNLQKAISYLGWLQ